MQIGQLAKLTASFSNAAGADYYVKSTKYIAKNIFQNCFYVKVVHGGQIVDHGRCSPKSDRKARNKHKQLCKTGRIRRTCYISFEVTSSMAPKVTLVVSQRALAASRITFDVTRSTESAVC